MDWQSIWLGFVAIATVFGFGLGLKQLLDWRPQRKVSIQIFSCQNLYSRKNQELTKLKIEYDGSAINTNVYWISGRLKNIGTRDLDRSIIHQPLTFYPPAGTWIEFSATAENGPDLTTSVQGQSASISWDILKRGEEILFSGLCMSAETKSEASFIEGLRTDHRITDLRVSSTSPRHVAMIDAILPASYIVTGIAMIGAYLWHSTTARTFLGYETQDGQKFILTTELGRLTARKLEKLPEALELPSVAQNVDITDVDLALLSTSPGMPTWPPEIFWMGSVFVVFGLLLTTLLRRSSFRDRLRALLAAALGIGSARH